MKKFLSLFSVLVLSVLLLSGCGSSSTKTASETDPLADGVLQVAMDDTYLPMEYRDDKNELVGFDVDFSKALAEKLGVKADISAVAWDGIFTGLTANQYDLIVSTTSITPERQESYSMSDPYIANGIVIVSRKDDANPAVDFDALEGKTVGVQIETSADIAAKKLQETTGKTINLKEFDGMLDAFSALEGKQIDYIMTDSGVAEYYATQKPDVFVVSSKALTNEPVGTTARKADTALTEKVNTAIKELKEDGTLKKISEKWFGKDLTADIDTKLNVIE